MWKSSTGAMSLESAAPAKKPMPRSAKTYHTRSTASLASPTATAARIALRASRNDGSGGDSRMPVGDQRLGAVGADRLVADGGDQRVRRSHSVCVQISPSECTSGEPSTVPKSPNV